MDLWVLKNRIKFDFTYFVKDQKNQLDNIPLVAGTGYTGLLTNIGDVRSKGYEWGLTVTPVRSKDLNWDISASFTQYKATITRLSDKFASNGYIFADYDGKTRVKLAVGEQIGNLYEQNPILRVKSGKYAGMPLLDGEGGEFQTSGEESDREMLGNFNPDYILGFNTTFRYKQFSLNLVGSFRKGGKYVSVNQQYIESDGRLATTFGSGPNNPSGRVDAILLPVACHGLLQVPVHMMQLIIIMMGNVPTRQMMPVMQKEYFLIPIIQAILQMLRMLITS